jgi:hypothetical protein
MYLPLVNNPEEKFNISINEIVYSFKQLWNTNGFWTLDITDPDGVVLVYGVKLVTQLYLLIQYPHIPFDLYSSNELDPDRNSLNEFLLDVSIKDV